MITLLSESLQLCIKEPASFYGGSPVTIFAFVLDALPWYLLKIINTLADCTCGWWSSVGLLQDANIFGTLAGKSPHNYCAF